MSITEERLVQCMSIIAEWFIDKKSWNLVKYVYDNLNDKKREKYTFADYKCRIPIGKNKFSFAYGILQITPTELRVVNLVVS